MFFLIGTFLIVAFIGAQCAQSVQSAISTHYDTFQSNFLDNLTLNAANPVTLNSSPVDVDKILEKANKLNKDLLDLKKDFNDEKTPNVPANDIAEQEGLSEETTFIINMLKKSHTLHKNHIQIQKEWQDRIEASGRIAKDLRINEIVLNFAERVKIIQANKKLREQEISGLHSGIFSVDTVKKIANLEEKRFKETRQAFQKAEEKVDQIILGLPNLTIDAKKKYEEDRSKWKEKMIEDIRKSKKEKEEFQKELTSKLEKSSEMANDYLNEAGPDYTAGDD
jgi:hypothetical protein